MVLKEIQSQIARKIDEGQFVAMGSPDVDLLKKRLLILGLPSDWLDLLEAWLRDRAAFVEVSADRSMLFDVSIDTVQGSILGPVLFSLFFGPVFGLNKIVAYADDTYTIISSSTKANAVVELGKALTTISL